MLNILVASTLIFQTITAQSGYVRAIERTDGVEVSQTLVKHLVAPGKPDLCLVGVAHIGTKEYYAEIQSILDAQSTVLYEGVRSKAHPFASKKPDPKAPRSIYQILSDAVGLDFQLADIQYNRPGWINSDLSMEQLEAINKKTAHGKPTEFDNVEKMLDPNSPQTKMLGDFFKSATPGVKEALKIFLVEKLAKIDTFLAASMDATTLNVILGERNKSIETVFDKVLSSANPPKSIAIFYGAAHLTAVQKDLTEKYGYKPYRQEWITIVKADRRKLDASGSQFLDTLGSLTKGR